MGGRRKVPILVINHYRWKPTRIIQRAPNFFLKSAESSTPLLRVYYFLDTTLSKIQQQVTQTETSLYYSGKENNDTEKQSPREVLGAGFSTPRTVTKSVGAHIPYMARRGADTLLQALNHSCTTYGT